MSATISTGSPARFNLARLAQVAILALAVVVSACGGSDAIDPLAPASFAAGGNGGNGGNGGDNSQATSLSIPQSVVATVQGTTVTVTWTAVANAGQYHVQLASATATLDQKTTSTTAVFNGLSGGSYTAKVRAENNAPHNGSDWSGASNAVTVAVTPPSTPAADNTPPVITFTINGTPGNGGWYTSDVLVDWTVTDAESAISANTCADFSVTGDQNATTYNCSATSAGGTSSSSVTIKRDATVPAIAFSGNAGTYTVDQFVAITCSATDATSGIASSSCPSASGAAYLFIIGSNSLSASASDNAGNANSASTSFTVSVTAGSLCNLTQRFVSSAGIANSMCVKLNAAGAAIARGNMQAKAGPLGAYVKEVQAQTGKSVSAANAAILINLASKL